MFIYIYSFSFNDDLDGTSDMKYNTTSHLNSSYSLAFTVRCRSGSYWMCMSIPESLSSLSKINLVKSIDFILIELGSMQDYPIGTCLPPGITQVGQQSQSSYII